ncbi:MAG: arginine--tRNA ligase [Bacteroidetes Order II. Incertae sedis bacterium]|jgi:arginyl-tRNA synthetase|nr:arginine--tRNA ligase [Bacteroidetes Order II. bacterium]MBT4052420.1 arginine--tRNA ligase [Bacteroidetes Order II. bacterium]MBT4602476.1 arginine--tRNA ligase [Bacteroidetes Order II. bacterium]MBT5249940.1 arginine--tRNA ligase [Bacteroidetes Order II. bacterium]MBT6200646.1 arginine--tRNA ligase [Bacteroidetes Order II. bacterium]
MQTYLHSAILGALSEMGGAPDDFQPEFQQPGNPDHGDLACNAAMQLARHFRKAPRQIAEDLKAHLEALPVDSDRISAIEVAGPGFLNFRFSDVYLFKALSSVLEAGDSYGRTHSGEGKRALVEFVSANPTGPLTVGHGRNAVLGDTVANLLEWTGFEVDREYYFNDAGRQMRILGESVQARYLAAVNPDLATKMIGDPPDETSVPEPFPEDGYLGDYITDIAIKLVGQDGLDPNDSEQFKKAAEKTIFADIEGTLGRMGIKMDAFFNEKSLYDSGQVWDIVEKFRELDLAYDKDGAVWLKTTAFGKEQDTVLVKSSGEPTYRLPDIGYHVDKLKRGYDRIVDIFGADHIATFPDVVAGTRALGFDADRIDVVIYQFVTLVRSGQPVKMSTRKATFVTLDELMNEVGEDVTRFFFLMRSPNTHLEFDLDLAKEASDTNPVFYLQYAHARIQSILRKASELGLGNGLEADVTLLTHDAEITLMKTLMGLPDSIVRAATHSEPHRLAGYLREVAVAFSQFYNHCRIVGEEEKLAAARLQLARATALVLCNGLTVLGISAPDRM